MLWFLTKALRAVITMWLVVTFVFFVLRLSGDPTMMLLPDDAAAGGLCCSTMLLVKSVFSRGAKQPARQAIRPARKAGGAAR